MPVMDGFETTQYIREKEPADAPLPIVAITAKAMKGDRERCFAAGMNDYIAKPVTMKKLQQVLAKWLPSGKGAGHKQQATEKFGNN